MPTIKRLYQFAQDGEVYHIRDKDLAEKVLNLIDKELLKTPATYYTASDPEVIAGIKHVGDLKKAAVYYWVPDTDDEELLRQLANGSIKYVSSLPTWADAEDNVFYLVTEAETGLMTGYKKDPDHSGVFFELKGNDAIPTEDIDDIFDEVFG